MSTSTAATPKARRTGLGETAGGRQTVSVVTTFGLAAVLFIAATIYSSGFASIHNIQSLSIFASFTGIAALGQTFVVLGGGLDLSVPWLIGFGGIELSQLTNGNHVGVWLAVALVIILGMAIGAVTGLAVVLLKAPPLIVTLGMGGLVEGYLVAIGTLQSNGAVVPTAIEQFSTSKVGPVPAVTLAFIVVAACSALMLKRTLLGRKIFLAGSNPAAARLAGIRVSRIRFATYVLSGGCATLAGVFLTGYIQTAYLDMGSTYLFGSVAALALGGTALLGGTGSSWGTVAGACTLTILAGFLPLLGLNDATVQIVDGMIILLGVYIARNSGRLSSLAMGRRRERGESLAAPAGSASSKTRATRSPSGGPGELN